MSSPPVQDHFLSLASLLQFLRGAIWFTVGVIAVLAGLDPTLGAQTTVIRAFAFGSATMVVLGILAIANGVVQVVAGYQVVTWRETKLWRISIVVAALDAIAWAELGLRLDARSENALSLTCFIFTGLATLAAIGIFAGRRALSRRI